MPPPRGVSAAGPLPEPIEEPFWGPPDGSLPKPVEGLRFDELPVLVSTLIPHSPCPEFRPPGGARHVLPGSVLLFGPRATRRARTGSTRPHTAVGPVNPAVGRRTRAPRDR